METRPISPRWSVLRTLWTMALLAAAAWVGYQQYGEPAGDVSAASSGRSNQTAQPAPQPTRSATPRDKASPQVAKQPHEILTDLIGIGVEVGHEVSRQGNDMLDEVAGLSLAEELAAGRQAYGLVAARYRLQPATETVARLERLAQPFLQRRARQDVPYHFAVVEEPTVNAFAHLGGYVYVYRGLLDLVTTDDELRFILGHEIAHCDLRHCVKNMTVVVRMQQAGGALAARLAGAAFQAIAIGYSQDLEFEADLWSYRQMRCAERSHEQSLQGLRLLQRNCAVKSPDGRGTGGPSPLEHLANHFRSHPPVAARLSQLEPQRGHALAAFEK